MTSEIFSLDFDEPLLSAEWSQRRNGQLSGSVCGAGERLQHHHEVSPSLLMLELTLLLSCPSAISTASKCSVPTVHHTETAPTTSESMVGRHTNLPTSQIHYFLLSTASDFADGESWGYRKYYELSRLVRKSILCYVQCIKLDLYFPMCSKKMVLLKTTPWC